MGCRCTLVAKGGVESCLQPFRHARPFPTPWLHHESRGGLGVGTSCRCFLLFGPAHTCTKHPQPPNHKYPIYKRAYILGLYLLLIMVFGMFLVRGQGLIPFGRRTGQRTLLVPEMRGNLGQPPSGPPSVLSMNLEDSL